MNVKALQSLADSSAWKTVRDELIAQRINDIKDVTKEIDTDLDLKPADAYVAKLVAAQAVQSLVNEIDRYSSTRKQTPTNYN